MQNLALNRKDICAVLISFFPEIDLFEKIVALSSQVERIFIIDNTPHSDSCNVDKLRHLLSQSEGNLNVEWISNAENIGQSSALNIGVRMAIDAGHQWVLTLDQDSVVPNNYIELMCAGYNEFIFKHRNYRIASITPLLVSIEYVNSYSRSQSTDSSFGLGGVRVQGDSQIVKRAITSGNIVNLSVFPEIGLFDEDFFIDFVDTEFCIRLKKYRYDILRINNAHLFHAIGNSTEHKLLFKTIKCSNHHPVRYYYFYRNSTATLIRYLRLRTCYLVLDVPKIMLFRLMMTLLFESKKLNKSSEILQGVLHGLLGVSGPRT
jgi:rhamnosyltransferase